MGDLPTVIRIIESLGADRILWIGVGVLVLIINHFAFSFNVVRSSIFKTRVLKDERLTIKPEETKIPVAKQFTGFTTHVGQLLKLTIFYFKMVFKEIPFIAIVVAGMLLMFPRVYIVAC